MGTGSAHHRRHRHRGVHFGAGQSFRARQVKGREPLNVTIKKVAPRRTPYENLPLLPWVVAETVCSQPYTGLELSRQLRSPRSLERIEGLRSKMTQKECREFAELVDANCKAAYKAKAEW